MPRVVRDAKIDNRSARARLKVRRYPHFQTLIVDKFHLGYVKQKRGEAGVWRVRLNIGRPSKTQSPYTEKKLGVADDFEDADGRDVLSHEQAVEAARAFRDAYETRDQRATKEKEREEAEARRPPTVAEAIDEYLQSQRKAEKKAVGDAESRARTHILPALGERRLDELTTDELEKWLNAMAETPARVRTSKKARMDGAIPKQNFKPAPLDREQKRARQSSANRTLTVLKAALNRAYQRERVASARAWERLEAFSKVDAARPEFLEINEAEALINAADEPSGFRALVKAAVHTGARYGELCALDVRDFARGQILIRDSKSGRPRDIRLSHEGRAFFETLTAGRSGAEPMLLRVGERRACGKTINERDRWTCSDQQRPLRAALRAAGLPGKVTFHALRHTWASLAVMGGMPLLVVAKNLGHTDTRMVEKHYGHLSNTYLDDVFAKHAPRIGAAPNVVDLASRRGGAA